MASALCSELRGRRAELAVLRSLLANPSSRPIAVLGEAGMGKTRVVNELASVAANAGWQVLRGHATPETRSPYRPIQWPTR